MPIEIESAETELVSADAKQEKQHMRRLHDSVSARLDRALPEGKQRRQWDEEIRGDIIALMKLLGKYGERGDIANFRKKYRIYSSNTIEWEKQFNEGGKSPRDLLQSFLDRMPTQANGDAQPPIDGEEKARLERELAELEGAISPAPQRSAEKKLTRPAESDRKVAGNVLSREEVMNKRALVIRAFLEEHPVEEIVGKIQQEMLTHALTKADIRLSLSKAKAGAQHLNPLIQQAIEDEFDLGVGHFNANVYTPQQWNKLQRAEGEQAVALPKKQTAAEAPQKGGGKKAKPQSPRGGKDLAQETTNLIFEAATRIDQHDAALAAETKSEATNAGALVPAPAASPVAVQKETAFRIKMSIGHQDEQGETVLDLQSNNAAVIKRVVSALVDG